MPAYSYEFIRDFFEEKKCKLLTTRDDFINNNMKATSKYKIISSCGHIIDECYFHTFKNRNSGIVCKNCIPKNKDNKSFNTEETAFQIITEILKDSFEINISDECVSADFCIKSKLSEDNLWFPIQLKSTMTTYKTTVSFGLNKKNYENMIVMFMCIKPII
jgi:hypothetical protein